MKNKALLWGIFIGSAVMFVICIAIGTYQAKCREKCQEDDFNKVMAAYFELDGALLDSARNNFENKNFQEALYDMKKNDEIRNVIHSDVPDYSPVRESEAVICLTKLIDLNQKIENNPNDYRLYIERANLQNIPRTAMFVNDPQTFCSDFQAAYEDFSKVIELNPNVKDAYEKRADALSETFPSVTVGKKETKAWQERYEASLPQIIADREKAIELNGKSPERLKKLVGAYIGAEQYEKAIKIIEELKSDDAASYWVLALCYEGLNNPQETVKNIDLFVPNMQNCKPEPCQPDKWAMRHLYGIRAKANFKLHRYTEALKDFIKSVVYETPHFNDGEKN